MNNESIRLDEDVSKVPVWKDKNDKYIPMSELTDSQLNNAVLFSQRRQMRSLYILELDEKLEKQLREEAKKRNLKVEGLEIVGNHDEKIYHQSKKVLEGVFATIKRRRKSFEKAEEN